MHAGLQGELAHWDRDRSIETGGDLPDPLEFRPAWWSGALCHGSGTDVWFPERGDYGDLPVLRVVCRACPARPDCMEDVMRHRVDTPGVWGGLTGSDRKRLHRTGELTTPSGDGMLYDRDSGDVVIVPAVEPLQPGDARALLAGLIASRELVAAG